MKIRDISEDGRFVLIESTGGGTIMPGVITGSAKHVFILDRSDYTWRLVNVPYYGGAQSGSSYDRNSDQASMTCDGSLVVFRSQQTNLTPNDTNGRTDIFLADMRNGVSIINITEMANNPSDLPLISCDGRYVIFRSQAMNIVPGTPYTSATYAYIYRYDRLTGDYDVIPQSTAGVFAAAQFGQGLGVASIGVSDYGDVVFGSNAKNLIDGYSGSYGLYIRKVDQSVTETLSIDYSGNMITSTATSMFDGLTAEGKYVVFIDNNSSLVQNDTNGYADVFLAETGLKERNEVRFAH